MLGLTFRLFHQSKSNSDLPNNLIIKTLRDKIAIPVKNEKEM